MAKLIERTAEFICNLPAPELGEPLLSEQAWVGTLFPGNKLRVFVEVDPSWVRVGDNLIGPAYGKEAPAGHVGIYCSPLPKEEPQQHLVEFFAYERIGMTVPEGMQLPAGHVMPQTEKQEFQALAQKLQSNDDCQPYLAAHNGAWYRDNKHVGHLARHNVLPELTCLTFDNLALAWIHALRPSTIRISRGCVCTDAWPWRVTVYLDKDDRIESVEQEVEVGYGCGSDIERITRARYSGKELQPTSAGPFGNVRGLERAEFT